MYKILLIHQNFPAQFTHLAQALARLPGIQPVAITDAVNKQPNLIPTIRYNLRQDAIGRPHKLAESFSARVARGEKVGQVMLGLRDRGFNPDLVIGHMGWGETLFVKDVWPKAKLVVHAEYYYRVDGGDIGFDPEFDDGLDKSRDFAVRTKNAAILMAVSDADYGVAPTRWQGSRFPPFLRNKIAVLHEGIDTDFAVPRHDAHFTIPGSKIVLTRNSEVITFVNRNLEPYRGYHIFMRALPEILKARPEARAVIVGGNGVSYGKAPASDRSWREVFLEEVRGRLPMDRVHFVGKVPYPNLLNLLRVSSAHIYLTYPFVLSWSMLDAMSVGGLVIGSRTAPVQEVIVHGENGLMFNFFDFHELAQLTIEALQAPERFYRIRENARRAITGNYDMRRICVPKWLGFLNMVTDEAMTGAAKP